MALPRTLKPGSTAARRALYSAATTNSPPSSATDGFVSGFRYVNFWAKCVAGTNFTVGFWQYSSVSGVWSLRTDVGTDGYLTVTPTTPAEAMLDTACAERVAVEVKTVSGPPDHCYVWGEGYTVTD